MKAPPVRAFEGWLKQHTPLNRNEVGDFIFARAFPHFDGDGKPPGDAYGSLIMEALTKAGKKFEVMDSSSDRPGRRFSGDMGKYQFIPRGRYSTVCMNQLGDDGGTLKNELESYTDPPKTGYVRVVDLAMPNPLVPTNYPALASSLVVLISDLPFLPSPLKEELFGAFAQPQTDGATFVLIPYTVRYERISRVLDLRYADARAWMCDTFSRGLKNSLIYHGPKLSKDFGFFEFWPSLFGVASGGTVVDDHIGAYLQSNGVEALIFPSARSDARAVFEHGDLRSWGGWNLVDYRHTPWAGELKALNRSRELHLVTPWEKELPGGRRFIVAPPNDEHVGSFRVERCEYSHRLLRHFQLLASARSWIAKGRVQGEQRWLELYVWFRSTFVILEGKEVHIMRCRSCDEMVTFQSSKAGSEALLDTPERCGACGFDGVAI